MKTLILLIAFLATAFAQSYPGSIATPLVAGNNIQTTLSAPMASGDTVAVVASSTGWTANMFAYICDGSTSTVKCTSTYEIMKVTSILGNVLTVTRAQGGTSAVAHASGKQISNAWTSPYNAGLWAEVVAIQTALGVNLSNVAGLNPFFSSATYNWTPYAPGGSIAVGSNVITMASGCPAGLNTYSVNKSKVYLSAGTGTAEAVPVTGGTCTSGTVNGTLIVTAANTHTGAWTVGPASFGMQEAINATCAAGGGTATVPDGSFTLLATVRVPCGSVTLKAGGIYGTNISRTGDFGDSITVESGLSNVHISGLTLSQTVNFAQGPPTSISNAPTSGAHIAMTDCNTCSIRDNQLWWMPYGIRLIGSAFVYIERNQIRSVWDYANVAVQVGVAGISVERTDTSNIPTYIFIYTNAINGPTSAARAFSVNGNTITQPEAVGPKYGVWLKSCEVCAIAKENTIEVMSYYGIYLAPPAVHAVSDPLLQIRIDQNYIDYARLSGVEFDNSANPGNSFILNASITNNEIMGSSGTLNGVHFTDAGSIPTAASTIISHNQITNTLGSGIFMLASVGTQIHNNLIAGYNNQNSYPLNTLSCSASPVGCTGDRLGNSAVYASESAHDYIITGNRLGGSILSDPYDGVSFFTVNGVTIGLNPSYALPDGVTAPNSDNGVQAVGSRSVVVPYDPAFFVPLGAVKNGNVGTVAVSGCGTLNANSTLIAGFITSATTGACTPVLTITNATGTNGWSCPISNQTTANLIRQTASAAGSITWSGTTVSGDVLAYGPCAGR